MIVVGGSSQVSILVVSGFVCVTVWLTKNDFSLFSFSFLHFIFCFNNVQILSLTSNNSLFKNVQGLCFRIFILTTIINTFLINILFPFKKNWISAVFFVFPFFLSLSPLHPLSNSIQNSISPIEFFSLSIFRLFLLLLLSFFCYKFICKLKNWTFLQVNPLLAHTHAIHFQNRRREIENSIFQRNSIKENILPLSILIFLPHSWI